MKEVYEKLYKKIDELANESITLLKKLVQEKSVQGKESNAQAIVIEKLRQLGLELDIYEPSKKDLQHHQYFVTNRDSFSGSSNVVAISRGTGGGKSIILNGHIDVVPEGDMSKWKYDPYLGVIEDGKLYGRGSTDMKGGNVALILALEAIISSGVKLKGDVIFQSVIDEEAGGAGSLSTILRGYRADAALIPEPTNMKLFIKQQGSMWFRVIVKGKSAHGGTRYEGVSALDKAITVNNRILELEKIRNSKVNDSHYKDNPIPFPINIGVIKGGNWPSSVPDEVVLEGRIGVAPNEFLHDVRKELELFLTELQIHDDWFYEHPVTIEWFGAHWIPNEIAKDHPFVELVTKQYQEVYQDSIEIGASPWGTDAGLYGVVANIPALVIGPGETKVAHYHNEFIVVDEVITAAKMFAIVIAEWCGVSEKKVKKNDSNI